MARAILRRVMLPLRLAVFLCSVTQSVSILEGNTISHGLQWLLPDRSQIWKHVTHGHLALSYSVAGLCSATKGII